MRDAPRVVPRFLNLRSKIPKMAWMDYDIRTLTMEIVCAKECVTTHLTNPSAQKMDGAVA